MMNRVPTAFVLVTALLLTSCMTERDYFKYLPSEAADSVDGLVLDGTGETVIGDGKLGDPDHRLKDAEELDSDVSDVGPDIVDTKELDEVEEAIDIELDIADEECVPACDGKEPCSDDGCGGMCQDGCDDGDACNGVEFCEEFECKPGEGKDCLDDDLCDGEETCNSETGECEEGEPIVCDDGLSCNGVEVCNLETGECDEGVDPVACDDENPCTEDTCDPDAEDSEALTGCTYIPLDDAPALEGKCDDANPCTYDNCLAGDCDNPVKPLEELGEDIDVCVCDTDDDCLELDDFQFCNGQLYCELPVDNPDADYKLCQVDPATVPDCAAEDGLFCNGQETCAECPDCDGDSNYACEPGEPPVLDDGVACTIDTCDEEADAVLNTPTDSECDDENVCTADVCAPDDENADEATGCVYTAAEPVEGEDNIECTPEDLCEVNGLCEEMECAGENLADLTVDDHEDGCDDEDVCTEDSCVVEGDAPKCEYAAVVEVTSCEDGNLCTLEDSCADMLCVAGVPKDCNDNDACTDDSCDSQTGECVHTPVDNDDNDPCTDDACDSGSGEITHLDKDYDDGLYCNGEETCDPVTGEMLAGVAPVVDDLVGCTVDLCDEENDVVTHTADDALCDNQKYCDGVETCDQVLDCQDGQAVVCEDDNDCTDDSCDEDADGCKYVPDNSLCVDEVACTITEACDVDIGCTLDLDHDLCDDGNDCTDDVCDPEDGCLNTPVEDDTECVATEQCTINAACQAGVCTGEFDLENCGDFDHDGLTGDADLCPYAFDPGNPAANGIPGTDACEAIADHGDFKFQRELKLSEDGATSQWRRTHEPVEIPLANGIIDDSVQLYLKMDGNTSDSGVNGNVLGGGTSLAGTSGAFENPNGGMKFVDGSSYLHGAATLAGMPATISAWVKFDKLQPAALVILRPESGLKPQFDLVWLAEDGELRFHVEKTGGVLDGIKASVMPVVGEWYHVAAVRYGEGAENMALWVNGQLQPSNHWFNSGLTPDQGFAMAYIGGNPDGSQLLEGSLDDVIVSNRPWSPDEIETYYRSGAPYGTTFMPGSQPDFDDVRVTEVGDDGKEFVKRSRVLGPRHHSDTPCPMDANDGTWEDRDDLCGVVAYWPLDGDAKDVMGDNDGVNNGAVPGLGRLGDSEGAMVFDGQAQNVSLGDAEEFLLSNVTLELWVLPEDCAPGETNEFLVKNKSGWHDDFLLRVSNDCKFEFMRQLKQGETAYSLYSDEVVALGVWTHVAVTMDGSTASLYVNGVLQDTHAESGALDGGTDPLVLGCDNQASHCFKGKLDEALVHNVAKSPDYIYHRANPGVPKLRFLGNTQVENAGTEQNPSYPLRDYKLYWGDEMAEVVAPLVSSLDEQKNCYGLLSECMGYAGWWRFNEGSGEVAVDSSGWKRAAVANDLGWRSGRQGTAGDFNGKSSYVKLIADLIPVDGFTAEASVSFDDIDTAEWDQIIRWGEVGSHQGFCIYKAEEDADYQANGSSMLFMSYSDSKAYHIGHIPTTIGSWQGIAGTYDGGLATLYGEQTKIGEQDWAYEHDDSGEFRIGSRFDFAPDAPDVSEAVDGAIDDVRLMNRALEPDELLHYPLMAWEMSSLLNADGLPLDTDGDGILDDGDDSGIIGDNPCIGGETEDCDDNAPGVENADQADDDSDGVGQVIDNCLNDANVDQADADFDGLGDGCDAEFTDIDHDGVLEGDLCPFAFDPGNPDLGGEPGTDACEKLAYHGDFNYQRDLTLSQDGGASAWRRTHEPVEIPLANGIIDDSVVGYWKLDGDAKDATGNHDGVNEGAEAGAGAWGDENSAMVFDGTDYINLGGDVAANGGSMSMSLWMKSATEDNPPSSRYPFGISSSSGVEWRCNVTPTGGIGADLRGANGNPSIVVSPTGTDYHDAQWHLISLVWDQAESTLSLFVDGRLERSGTGTLSGDFQSQLPLYLGGTSVNGPGLQGGFIGTIDEAVVFNRALSPDEIETYYRSNAPYGTKFVPGSQADFDDVRVAETTGDVNGYGDEYVKRSRVIGPRPHSDTPCPMDTDDGTWKDRDDLCGVVAYWPLDGDAKDVMGEHDGVNYGGTASSGRFGDPAGALDLDGEEDYVEIEDDPAFHLLEGTWETWVRIDECPTAVEYKIINKKMSGYENDASLDVTTDCRFVVAMDMKTPQVAEILQAQEMASPGVWTHVAFVWTANVKQLYVGGLLADQIGVEGPIEAKGYSLRLGQSGDDDGFLKGKLDEVVIHNVAKSADYIYHRARPGMPKLRFLANTQVQNAGTEEAPSYPLRNYKLYWGDKTAEVVAPLVKSLDEQKACYGLLSECMGYAGWWRFNEGSGDVAMDSSGNKHNGDLHDGPAWTGGLEGTALWFDGFNDRVYMLGVPEIPDGSGFALEAVARPDVVCQEQGDIVYIVDRSSGVGGYTLKTQCESGNAVGQVQTPQITWSGPVGPVLPLDKFTALGLSLKDDTLELYSNGGSPVSSVVASPDTTTPAIFSVATNAGATSHLFEGTIDSVRLMNRGLEPDEFLHYPLVDWEMGTEVWDGTCGGVLCPEMAGYDVSCNAKDHCEYANQDDSGWKKWDVWIYVAPGSFKIGSPLDAPDHKAHEEPETLITFKHGYLIAKYEIVVEQYEACLASDPAHCTPPFVEAGGGSYCGWGVNNSAKGRTDHPQNGLTWQQTRDFCNWVAPGGYLPSEAEWEYAAEGPVHQKYPWGNGPEPTCDNDLTVMAGNSDCDGLGCGSGGTSPVGSKLAGMSWSGALDMAGNIMEWTEDDTHYHFDGIPTDGSAWLGDGEGSKSQRGGSFTSLAEQLRSSTRQGSGEDYQYASMAGRCVRPAPATECGGVACPKLDGYFVHCNHQDHCEYTNLDTSGWKKWDVWIYVAPGSFEMGSPEGEDGHKANEEDPAGPGKMHPVALSDGFLIGKYEIVVQQYEACMAANPGKCTEITPTWDAMGWGANMSSNGRHDHPQNALQWQQAQDLCAWTAPGGRLPSEAEWAYAAKGPTHRKYPWGDSPEPTCANETAWFDEDGGGGRPWGCEACNESGCSGSKPVGTKPAGASWSGALDMAGNVFEWCADWWHDNYDGAPSDGSAWLVPAGSVRVHRGGSFGGEATHLRSAERLDGNPIGAHGAIGARCVRPLPTNCAPDCATQKCGDGQKGAWEECDDGNLVDGDGCTGQCISENFWVDADSGLTWQNPPTDKLTWDDAKLHCQNLVLGGHNDWRAPSIGEMRALVRGCEATEPDGACNVVDGDCMAWSCRDDACDGPGCGLMEGPADNGCYWPNEMLGPCDWYWSSSAMEESTVHAWNINFSSAHLGNPNFAGGQGGPVRCVRTTAGSCTPDCAGNECGDDGCWGSCGGCDDGVACTLDTCEDGQCVHVADDANCDDDGKECTSEFCDPVDGCNSTLLDCGQGKACISDKQCVPTCVGGSVDWHITSLVASGPKPDLIVKVHNPDGSVQNLPKASAVMHTTSCSPFTYIDIQCEFGNCNGVEVTTTGAQSFAYHEGAQVPPTGPPTVDDNLCGCGNEAWKHIVITAPFDADQL